MADPSHLKEQLWSSTWPSTRETGVRHRLGAARNHGSPLPRNWKLTQGQPALEVSSSHTVVPAWLSNSSRSVAGHPDVHRTSGRPSELALEFHSCELNSSASSSGRLPEDASLRLRSCALSLEDEWESPRSSSVASLRRTSTHLSLSRPQNSPTFNFLYDFIKNLRIVDFEEIVILKLW